MNRPAVPEPERELGKYHIVRPLKVGGTAAIYLAVLRGENNFSREVVIKRPLPHLVADGRARLMFIDEAHIASRLSHPNICQVLDLVAREDELYLVLEYLRGVDLREILKRCMELGRLLPVEVAVWIAIESAAGLDYAHEAQGIDGTPLRIIHRDVSPKNIRITDAGSVKVIDFGIARAQNRATETQAGTIKGTLGYMSPEQIMGDEIDHRSDIFAFGIVLFQMLTCRNPFDGPTLKERVRRLTQAPVPSVREFNGALDPEIEGIVARCLERDLDTRYQRLRDLQIALDRYLAKLQVVSPRQRLIEFMEEIFPQLHETDPELKNALTEISSITGRIDSTRRLAFPDDPESAGSATSASSASQPQSQSATRSTVGVGDTVSTIKDEPMSSKTAERPSAGSNGTQRAPPEAPGHRAPQDARVSQHAPADPGGVSSVSTVFASRPMRLWGTALLLIAVAAVAAITVVWLYERSSTPTSEPIEPTRPHAEASPDRSNGTAVPFNAIVQTKGRATTATAAVVAVRAEMGRDTRSDLLGEPRGDGKPAAKDPTRGSGSKTHVRVDSKSREVNGAMPKNDASPMRARMYFKTGVRLDGLGRTEDALLLYTLAYGDSGATPNVSILRNLGLLYNKSGDAVKAKACLGAYLDRSPSAPDAERIRTVISSFGATKSVPCVDLGELARAKKLAARKGAVIDSWVQETIDEGLRPH
jgi:serine/threonine-protein kinase